MTTTETPVLRRALGPWALFFYGVGSMLGGGIYALVGRVAGLSGRYCWLSFLLALLVATPTAFSYAALSRRHPHSGGESWYCQVAFGWAWLSFLVGWLVLFSGIVSTATLALALTGYAQGLGGSVPPLVVAAAFVLLLTAISLRGIRESSAVNIVCTIVECGGLLLVLAAGLWFLSSGEPGPVVQPSPTTVSLAALAHGAVLAFYAFIGFEDMVKVADEARSARRDLPRALLLGLALVGVIYIAVALISVSIVAPDELRTASAPLFEVIHRSLPALPSWVFILVALFAVGNTALVNFVSASRLMHGMAREHLLPGFLARVSAQRRTPARATWVLALLVLLLALTGGLEALAATTSLLLLTTFFLVNLALVVLEGRSPAPRRGTQGLALAGCLLSASLAVFAARASPVLALAIVLAGLLAHAVMRQRPAAT